MRYFFLLICFLSICSLATAQLQSIDVSNPASTGGNYGAVKFYDPSTIGNKKVETINYADISGSPYWNNDWDAAILIFNNDKGVKLQKAKLNLYTNELLYFDATGTQLAVENKIVKRVIFFKGQDTSKITGAFLSLPNVEENSEYGYFQVLNDGSLQLLKLNKVSVHTSEYDPISGRNDHNFITKSAYYIKGIGIFSKLQALSEAGVAAALTFTSDMRIWLSNQKNRLKSEADVIAFLNYCNTAKK
jgi:hypothetical protein